jgi:hypothetical protein
VLAVALVATGGGRYSLDHALGIHLTGARWALGVALAAVVSAGTVLSLFVRGEAVGSPVTES